MYNNRIKNIEIPENLFSNLGEMRSKKLNQNKINNTVEAELSPSVKTVEHPKNEDIKMTNFSKHKEYRNRLGKIYEGIKNIHPIDSEIDNVIYFNNYTEKGIVVKPKVSSLKQFWTEYRLIDNEKRVPTPYKTEVTEQKLTDFDELFEALQMRVSEINKYIDELKEMRSNIEKTSNELEKDKEKLSDEKQKFINYKKNEETKIKKEKENIKINYDRLQTIIDDLDKRLESIDQ